MKKILGKKLRNTCETVETYKGCGCYTKCSCKTSKSRVNTNRNRIQKKMLNMVAPGIGQ